MKQEIRKEADDMLTVNQFHRAVSSATRRKRGGAKKEYLKPNARKG